MTVSLQLKRLQLTLKMLCIGVKWEEPIFVLRRKYLRTKWRK